MRRAYHRISMPDGSVIEGPIVVDFDDEQHPISWHQLIAEEPATEWLGGTYFFEHRI